MSLIQSMRDIGRPVVYYARLARFFGSVNASILFSQLAYWQDRTSSPLGVFKSSDELLEETGLSYREQVTARKHLTSKGYLVETHKRLEHKIFYRLDFDLIDAAFGEWSKRHFPNCGKRSSPNDESAVRGLRMAQFVNSTEMTTEMTFIESPRTPLGGDEPDGSQGDVFPNLDDFVDLEELVGQENPAPVLQPTSAPMPGSTALPYVAQAPVVLPPSAGSACTTADAACQTLRAAGISDALRGNPKLTALLAAGATLPEFLDAAQRAVAAGSPRFSYALGIVANERKRAIELQAQLQHGGLPAKPERATFAQAQADLARSTVPSRPGRDPTLERIEADAARAAPPPPEIRARIDALRGAA